MTIPRIHFRRRHLFIKPGFQSRFAVFPILLLAALLSGAVGYLHWRLKQPAAVFSSLGHLQDPWQRCIPLLEQVLVWGVLPMLAVLGVWVWRWFGTLRRDLDGLADWTAAHARGQQDPSPPTFRDGEVRALSEGLQRAFAEQSEWDEAVREKTDAVLGAAAGLRDVGAHDRDAIVEAVPLVRRALHELQVLVADAEATAGR